MALYVVGSLAFDRIMTFPGKFEDHLLPEKLHILNVCFLIDSMTQKRGGTGGNIAYSLALLGEKPIIVASAGNDFQDYEAFLQQRGLPLEGITRLSDVPTAGAYITTDLSSNQITGFYPAAMNSPSNYNFPHCDPATDLAIVGPSNLDDMRSSARFFKEQGLRYIFDPGQQLPLFSAEELLDAIEGSFMLIANDYEMESICHKTGKNRDALRPLTQHLIVTLGEEGSVLYNSEGHHRIEAATADRVVDPTGCGDAYRAGLLKGLNMGCSVPISAQLGATLASFCVEHAGPQEHHFTMERFAARYTAAFGPMPDLSANGPA